MRARLWVCVCTAALTACKSDGGAGPTASYVGAWEGTTSQGKVLQFYVEEDGIRIAGIEFTIDGTSCSVTPTVYLTREMPDTGYTVDADSMAIHTAGTAGQLDVAGTFTSSTAASGTLRATSINCNGTVNATWNATKAAGATTGLAGTWTGNLSSTAIAPTPATITLSQTGGTLTGTFGMDNGATGTIAGTVRGTMGTFDITETTSGCTGSFSGHALRRSGTTATLFVGYSGNDCLGAHNRAGGVLTPAPLGAIMNMGYSGPIAALTGRR